jgi:hypothetical protein
MGKKNPLAMKDYQAHRDKQNEVMTIESQRWQEFCARLARAVSPNTCGHDHGEAEKILKEMGNIDVEASIDYFENNGGYCDCEILLNVDREWQWMDSTYH